MNTPTEADARAADQALRASGLRLTDEETSRLATGYSALRAKADALAALALREAPPINPVAPPDKGEYPR
ncbi:hypothetical protein BZB76_6625 [Actinomadura pelletieri DSM 43383]|uniref:Uncharacterized protein n=1 Tax=Actinomadura pelletieri DSM 43383 TaxID=1120940 RepID=A0A495QA66_9ACTN|nr:hypothetical protein [Actinomadura pelletieri]RKS68362.1 hypothetical protein BZB76_6625 [Actinomadura pelletieri DSM 43383]